MSVIDPMLPTLRLLFDENVIAEGFAAAWQNDGPPLHVGVVKMQHLRYQPGVACIAVYELCLEQAQAIPQSTLGVATCRPTGMHYRAYRDDPELPGLGTATDTAAIRPRLDEICLNMGIEQTSEWQITPIRYRPGSRCALRYSCQTPAEQKHFFAKLFRRTDPRHIEMVRSLAQKRYQSPLLPKLPPLLAYWPDLQMQAQAMIQGVELHDVVFSPQVPQPQRAQWMWHLGQSIATFHSQPQGSLPITTWRHDLNTIAAYLPAIARGMPALCSTFQAAIREGEAIAAGLATGDMQMSHGALRTDQFLITASHTELANLTSGDACKSHAPKPQEGKLVLIDLDTLCLAQPERDLGNCLAYLDWKAMRQPEHADFMMQASQILLDGYATQRMHKERHWLIFYRAISLLKIAGRRFCNLTIGEWPLTPQLVQRARNLIGEITQTKHFAYAKVG